MINRKKIKTLIFQFIRNNQLIKDWFKDNYGYSNFVEKGHFFEFGSDIASDDIVYPAIRYRLVTEEPKKDLCGYENIILDIIIESRKDNSSESDDLLNNFISIFLYNGGKLLNDYIQSLNNTNDLKNLAISNIDIVTLEQFRVDDQFIKNYKKPSITEDVIYNYVRFNIDLAEE